MPIPNIDPDDEIFGPDELAANAKRSKRWAQKMFELGEIESFVEGRRRVCLKSQYHAYLRRLIAKEAERLEELAE
jgi:hypothetical protein